MKMKRKVTKAQATRREKRVKLNKRQKIGISLIGLLAIVFITMAAGGAYDNIFDNVKSSPPDNTESAMTYYLNSGNPVNIGNAGIFPNLRENDRIIINDGVGETSVLIQEINALDNKVRFISSLQPDNLIPVDPNEGEAFVTNNNNIQAVFYLNSINNNQAVATITILEAPPI